MLVIVYILPLFHMVFGDHGSSYHPTPTYHTPAPTYHAPTPTYQAPPPSYHAPAPTYKDEPHPYSYEYGVHDSYSGADYKAGETSDGAGTVDGSYSVLLPDGRTQHVTYHADHYTGYVADVTYEGKASYHEEPYHAPAPTYHNPTPTYHSPAPVYHAPQPSYHGGFRV